MGNKWRKLHLNLEKARKEGFKSLVTLGGAFSNHIAATAAAAKEYGFDSIGIIRGEELTVQSNDTLRMAAAKGMQLRFVTREAFKNLRDHPEEVKKSYPSCYFLPEGGTNQLAIMGCQTIVPEIKEEFDLIVAPIGTGGTFCGVTSSLQPKQKAIGISTLKGEFMHKEIKDMMATYQINHPNYEVITSYHFGGYGKTTPELVDFINWFKEYFDIQLDPIYTGKSFFAVWDMIKTDKFVKNLKIVLLHTGGLQGISGFNRKNEIIIQ